MSAAITQALSHLDSRAQGLATRSSGMTGGDGYKIIGGLPGSDAKSPKIIAAIKAEADLLDQMNRETRRRFFGEDCPEPVKMEPREEIVPIGRPRRQESAPVAPKLPPVPTAEQQRIRALVTEARETRGFARRLKKAMHWDTAQFNGFLTGDIVSTPKTWAKLEEVVPHILATIHEEVWLRVGRKKLSPDATEEQIAEVRDYLATVAIPYSFWLHLRMQARVSSQAAWLVRPDNKGGNVGKRRVTVEQLERIRATVASGAVHEACATTATTRAEAMREKRAAQGRSKEGSEV